jgi:ankyrin repeat protein
LLINSLYRQLPQHYAAIGGHTNVMKLLLFDVRFDLCDAENEMRQTSFYLSVLMGHNETVSLLLTYIDPNSSDSVARYGTAVKW